MKKIKTTITCSTSVTVSFYENQKLEKTTNTVTKVYEADQIKISPEVIEKLKTLVMHNTAPDAIEKLKVFMKNGETTKDTKQKGRYHRIMNIVRGHVNWLNAMSYGVSGGVLTNILTGSGNVDINVALLVLTTLVITITGLVKVYFDVQFKDSG
jgi:hypothetical protein